jgi:hypothetical protein
MSVSPKLSPIGLDRRDCKQVAKALSPRGTLQRVLQQARPLWPHLGGILLLTLIATPLALLLPLPLK